LNVKIGLFLRRRIESGDQNEPPENTSVDFLFLSDNLQTDSKFKVENPNKDEKCVNNGEIKKILDFIILLPKVIFSTTRPLFIGNSDPGCFFRFAKPRARKLPGMY
jgi:hypothetical protein